MASADFSPFVVTHGLHTLFLSAGETSPSTTHFFPSIYLPYLLQLIPSSYWTLVCIATLSLAATSCDFCSSDQRFAYSFLQIPSHNGHPCCSAVSFPLLGRTRDFHPLEACAVGRTLKKEPVQKAPFCHIIIFILCKRYPLLQNREPVPL